MSLDPYAPSPAAIQPTEAASGSLSRGVVEQLLGTRPWVRVFSVLMFVGAGFMVLGGVIMLLGTGFATIANSSEALPMGIMGLVMAVFYILIAAVYIYPALKLWKYANGISALSFSGSQADLEVALREQRRFWKFLGVAMIAMFALYAVGIVLFIVFAGAAAAFGMKGF